MSGYMQCPLVPLSSWGPLGGQGGTSLWLASEHPRRQASHTLVVPPSLCLALQSPKPQGKRRVTHCKGRQGCPAHSSLAHGCCPSPEPVFIPAEAPTHDSISVICPKFDAPLSVHLDGLQTAAVIWIVIHHWLIVGDLRGSGERSQAAS